MLTPFPQNWRTSQLPYSLALTNAVNTGGSYTTPSNATQNSKIWASAGFRGFGPVMTYPGAGMDGMGCECGGECGGISLLQLVVVGLGLWALFSKHGADLFSRGQY